MICLTSDIHHMSLKTGNQMHSDRAEATIARDFAEMIFEKNMRATYFVSGKCFSEEWHSLREICSNPHIEIGGHTYNCFTPELWHRLCKKLLCSYNGPQWYQSRDIAATMRIIQERTDKTITSWRNHMYMHGPHTERALAENNIFICCDHVRRYGALWEKHPSGVVNFPLNIIPDHEHLYHAERTPDWVAKWVERYDWSDDYGSESYDFSDWFEIFKREVTLREHHGVVSHILIHPITIYLCGGINALRSVVDFLSDFESMQVTEFIRSQQVGRLKSDRGLTFDENEVVYGLA